MKIGEILRQLADLIDANKSGDAADGSDLGLLNASGIVPNVSIGPLQQELELLKKSNSVENDVETFAADDDAELAKMQQNAGISQPPVIINQTFEINAAPAATPEPVPEPTKSSTKESQFGHPRPKKLPRRSSVQSQYGTRAEK